MGTVEISRRVATAQPNFHPPQADQIPAAAGGMEIPGKVKCRRIQGLDGVRKQIFTRLLAFVGQGDNSFAISPVYRAHLHHHDNTTSLLGIVIKGDPLDLPPKSLGCLFGDIQYLLILHLSPVLAEKCFELLL